MNFDSSHYKSSHYKSPNNLYLIFLSKDSFFKQAYFFRMGPSPVLLGFFCKIIFVMISILQVKENLSSKWTLWEVCRKLKRVFITPLSLLFLVSVLRDGWDHLKFQPHMVKSLGTHHQIGWEDFFFRGHQKPRRAIWCWQKNRILVQRQIMSYARWRRWYNRFNDFPFIVS